MMVLIIILLVLSVTSLPCDSVVTPSLLYVDSDLGGVGLGSECDPFQDIDSALTTALQFPAAKVTLKGSAITIENGFVIDSRVEIEGNGVSLSTRKTVQIGTSGTLRIRNLIVLAESGFESPMISSAGSVNLAEVTVNKATGVLIEVVYGDLAVTDSIFSNFAGPLLIIQSGISSISFDSCEFNSFESDLMQIKSEMLFTMYECQIHGISGLIFNFMNESSLITEISMSNVEVGDSLGVLFGGSGNQVNLEIANSTFHSMREISHGSVTASNITFDECIFDTFSGSLFVFDSFSGSIDISKSEISNVNDGAIFSIPSNPYSYDESLISLTSCSIFNLTHLGPSPSSALIFAVSVTFTVSDSEIYHVTALALILISESVVDISDTLYRDSSVTTFAFMSATNSITTVRNFTMLRVENGGLETIAYLTACEGYWDGVRMEGLTAASGDQQDCTLLMVFNGTFEVRNSRFSLREITSALMVARQDSQLNVTNVTVEDTVIDIIFLSLINSFITQTNITVETVQANILLISNNIYVTIASGIHISESCVIQLFFNIFGNEFYLSDSVFHGVAGMTLISSQYSSISLQRVIVTNSKIDICRDCLETTLTIDDFTFQHIDGKMMFEMSDSQVTLSNGVIESSSATAFFDLTSSKVTIDRVRFVNCSCDSIGGLATATDDSSVAIHESQFANLTGMVSYGNGLISLQKSSLSITASAFEVFNATLVYAVEASIVIDNSVFRDGGLLEPMNLHAVMNGGVIRAENSTDVHIGNSVFLRIIADFGGVLYLAETSSDGSVFKFIGNEVHSCAALAFGGAIYGQSISLDVSHCLFTGNSAMHGGAIYLESDSSDFALTVTNSHFANNSAYYDGGAMQRIDVAQYTANSTFSGNTAIYGPNFASKSYHLMLLDAESRPLHNATLEAASGQKLNQTLVFGLIDDRNQLVSSDESTPLVLSPASTLEGLLLWYPISGKYFVTNLAIVAAPLSDVDLLGSTPEFTDVLVTFHMRACRTGG